jgi:hypothetical protein
MSRHEELGDALNAGNLASKAQTDYYSFMLLKEKLQAQGISPAAGGNAAALYTRLVGSRSEKEAMELHILAVIQGDEYGESSANYSQLVDLTGTRDKIQMAKFLAEKVYEREATKMILNRFAPPPTAAPNADPVSGQQLYGFQALINRPRDAANLAAGTGFGTRGQSVAGRALGALLGLAPAQAGQPILAGANPFAV